MADSAGVFSERLDRRGQCLGAALGRFAPLGPNDPDVSAVTLLRSAPLDGRHQLRHSDRMDVHPQSPPPVPNHPLQWTPAENLEHRLEARLLLWYSRKIGLAFHSTHAEVARTVLLGPVAEALGKPDDWLDDLESCDVLDRLEDAIRDLPAGQLEEALASYGGRANREGPVCPRPGRNAPGTNLYSPIAR